MIELHPNALSDEAELAWVDGILVESFLAAANAARPINLIGRATHLADHLFRKRPDLRVRAICPVLAEETPKPSSAADIHFATVAGIFELLLPRSRTLILNPFLAHSLLGSPAFWRALSLKTFDWVIAPFFIKPEPFFTLLSDAFSFEEPSCDDKAEHWCWTESPDPGVIWIVNGQGAGTYDLSFTLTGARPGTFEIHFGNATLCRRVTPENLTECLRLRCHLARGMNALRISFDGQPFKPTGSMDDRKELYFCFANLQLTPCRTARLPPSSSMLELTPEHDRLIRRLLHVHGFFEIQSIGTSAPELSHFIGLRSCFDYREGFRLRDYRRFPVEQAIATESGPDSPVLWYCLRKTPTPGSEWEDGSPSWAVQSSILLLAEHPSELEQGALDVVENAAGQLETRHLLEVRTAELEQAAQELVSRTGELVATRRLLEERTTRLERTGQDLVSRTGELVETRRLLEERTTELERTGQDLVSRTGELVKTRRLLMECTDEASHAREGILWSREELNRLTERLDRLSIFTARSKLTSIKAELRNLGEELRRIGLELEKCGGDRRH
jgi:hypothetical protein